MEINDEIFVRVPIHHPTAHSSRVYIFRARHYWSSNQVERFEVWGQDGRSIKLEKNLLEKDIHKSPWKILEVIVQAGNEKHAVYVINSIQGYLNDYLFNKASGAKLYWSGYYTKRMDKKMSLKKCTRKCTNAHIFAKTDLVKC